MTTKTWGKYESWDRQAVCLPGVWTFTWNWKKVTELKKLNEFKPEFIFFSAGFDAHKDDPLSNINLKSQDYFEITKSINGK